MQARGLKPLTKAKKSKFGLSRLMQARGLKQPFVGNLLLAQMVAPHAGAWIETGGQRYPHCSYRVAPHAGAWIETSLRYGVVQHL